MNSLRWVCSHARDWTSNPSIASTNADQVNHSDDPLDLMVRQFEDSQKALEYLRTQLTKAEADLACSRTDLNAQRRVAASATKNSENQRHEIRKIAEQRDSLLREAAELRGRSTSHSNLIKRLKDDVQRHQTKRDESINSEQKALRAQQTLQQRLVEVQQQLTEALFEIEHLKCVELAPSEPSRTVIPQNFVLVLVDGDAYNWATSLFRHAHPQHSPGALAASELHNVVSENLAKIPEISPASKIVVRVFFNESGKVPPSKYRNLFMQQKRDKTTFRRDFTQAMPLFDFFDAGTGKERADQKLRANFDLFVANPHCQHIFLAICTDNGFARMLEPHRYGGARSKITLVSPGYVCKEIEELGFRTVDWPSVFKERKRPPDEERSAAHRAFLAKEQADYNKSMGFEGIIDTRTAAYIQDIVPGHDTWIADTIRSVRWRGIYFAELRRATAVPLTAILTAATNPEAASATSEDDFVD